MRRLAIFLMLVAAYVPGTVLAQQAAVEVLRPSARALAQEPFSISFRTEAVSGGRRDLDTGVLRAHYDIEVRVSATQPAEAAQEYLRKNGDIYGVDAVEDLRLVNVENTPAGVHVAYRQIFGDVPVYGARIKVNLDRSGEPRMVMSSIVTQIKEDLSTTPNVRAADAKRMAEELFIGPVRLNDPELIIFPSEPARLAWRLLAWPEKGPPAEWEVLVDARTEEVVLLKNRAMRLRTADHSRRTADDRPDSDAAARETSLRGAEGDAAISSGKAPLPDRRRLPRSLRSLAMTNGDGAALVFTPDPLTSAGVRYGGAFVDNDDASTTTLANELKQVPLHGLTLGRDGRYHLSNDILHITGENTAGEQVYTPPAEADPNNFRYTRENDGFEAVHAYYYIYSSQTYVQSLGFAPPEAPVLVNPHATMDDASFYLPSMNFIAFGTGGIDDAEDAQVVMHEYAHALLQAAAPGLLQTSEGIALHEGWADYWAASHLRDLVETGEAPRTEWRQLFRWDSGDGAFWSGRRIPPAGHYPENAHCADGVCSNQEQYEDGLLWASMLMDVYDLLGRTITDRLSLASAYYLSAPVTFRDAAEALLQADRYLYGGVHLGVLADLLAERGFIDREPPVITTEPISSVSLVEWPPRIAAHVEEASGLDSVGVYFKVVPPNGQPVTTGAFPLRVCREGNYCGSFPLSAESILPGSRIQYRLYARDAAASKNVRYAPSASDFYSFTVTASFQLLPNTPNPFSQATTIRYILPSPADVDLVIYDALGRRVITLHDGLQGAGYQSIPFRAERLAAGVYFVYLRADERARVHPILLAK